MPRWPFTYGNPAHYEGELPDFGEAGAYVYFEKRPLVLLDGHYTIEHLENIIAHMRNLHNPPQETQADGADGAGNTG